MRNVKRWFSRNDAEDVAAVAREVFGVALERCLMGIVDFSGVNPPQIPMPELSQLLNSKVIPWTMENAPQRLMIARNEMESVELPEGATLTLRKLVGRRAIVKNRRNHAGERLHIADWPKDNLHEIAPPKLACILGGQADYLLGEYCLHCDEGTFILIPPRMPHQRSGPFLQGEALQNGNCTLLQVYVYSHGVYVWQSRSQSGGHTNVSPESYLIPNMAAVQIFKLLFVEAIASQPNFEKVCNGLMTAFFTLLSREVATGNYMHPGPESALEAPSTAPADFAGKLHALIAANFNTRMKLEDVAAQMYLSTPQFCRRVRAETGETFGELLTRYRIERACELLGKTDWTAAAIAGFVGFGSAAHFQQLFRRRVGCTPISYRQQKR